MENEKVVVRAQPRITGAGLVISELYQVDGDEGFPVGDMWNRRVGFSGLLRGTYEGLPTVAVEHPGALRWGAR